MVCIMNKKLMSLVLVGMLGFGMIGCSKKEEITVEQVETKVMEEEEKVEEKQEIDVVIENEYYKITLKEKYQDEVNQEVGYKVEIENKCDRTIGVYVDKVSIGDTMNETFYFYEEVTVGKKCNSDIVWATWMEGQEVKSMEDLKDVQLTIVAYDIDTGYDIVEETIAID